MCDFRVRFPKGVVVTKSTSNIFFQGTVVGTFQRLDGTIHTVVDNGTNLYISDQDSLRPGKVLPDLEWENKSAKSKSTG